MLKKRLIGVVTIKDGLAVQSFGYGKYLPLGSPECLVENLDRWGADEILVKVIDRSLSSIGPDFELVKKLGKLGIATPLIYAGGIRSVSDGVELIRLGADRLVIDSLLHDDIGSIQMLSKKLGAQALIASIPLSIDPDGILYWYDYRSKVKKVLPDNVWSLFNLRWISEILITDWIHEGLEGSFDGRLVDKISTRNIPMIAFGGISELEQMRGLLSVPNLMAIGVGNFLAYKEHAIQEYKKSLNSFLLRAEVYDDPNLVMEH